MTEHRSDAFHLERETLGLQLHKSGERGGVKLSDHDLRRRLRQGKRLLLARACAAGPGVSVLDATAGFGLDGLTLSALGCSVTLCERHPMVFALLEDSAHRLGSGALARGDIKLLQADAHDVLCGPDRFDVVYLDPMFPPRGKSALPNKRARYLADLVGQDQESVAELLMRARRRARRRVVVKRRRLDPELGSPSFALHGRAVRFDVYQATL